MYRRFLGFLFIYFTFYSMVFAQELRPLTNQDESRSNLARYEASLIEPGSKGLGIPFIFPDDAKSDRIYGLDVSHHNMRGRNPFPWDSIQKTNVVFVYMKATQGTRFFDPTFKDNWSRFNIRRPNGVPLLRGAYHFLSSDGDPKEQANTFINILRTQIDYSAIRDMPPVLDIEWDCRIQRGRCNDRWQSVAADEIAEKITAWVAVVEKELGVRPIIYTSAVWWNERGLHRTSLASNFHLWVADYTGRSISRNQPRTPQGRSYLIWQFTDNGQLNSSHCDPTKKTSTCVDINQVPLDEPSFLKILRTP